MTDLSISQYVQDVMTTPTDSQADQAKIGAEISIEQLYKYYADVKVLEDLDLNIEAGEFVAIVGRSGCGKSTLLRLIADLEQPSYGEIKFKSRLNFREGIISDDIRVMF